MSSPLYFLFKGDQIWIRKKENGTTPLFTPDAPFALSEPLRDSRYRVAATDAPPTPDATLLPLRQLFDVVEESLFLQAGQARQLLHWRTGNRFCSRCGAPLSRHAKEHALVCSSCGFLLYPRLNPVVITLVHRGREILLTHKAHHLYPFWSLIAGFVEPNEGLEEAVQREVAEETGICVKNIHYAGSQPWPFPNNLMIGFFAEYDAGQIRPDGEELDDTQWFSEENLPVLPTEVSIARRMINHFFATK